MNKKQNVNVMPGMALFGAAVLMGAHAMNSVAQDASAEQPAPVIVNCEGLGATSEIVKIKFEANGCPMKAIPDKFEITGTEKFICWESVDSAGNRQKFNFELFFDPFNGTPHGSDGNGLVRAKISKDAPITESGVDYKYTVYGKDCSDEDAKFYDPRFTVRK